MVVDVPNSAVALAVSDIAKEKNKVFIGSGAGTALLAGGRCAPNTSTGLTTPGRSGIRLHAPCCSRVARAGFL